MSTPLPIGIIQRNEPDLGTGQMTLSLKLVDRIQNTPMFCLWADWTLEKGLCYEITGYPNWWKDSRNCRTNQMKECDEKQASRLLTTTCTSGKALHYVSTLNNTCVIYSGATDHMTFDSKQVTLLTLSSQTFVSTANSAPIPMLENDQSFYLTP